MIPSTRGVEIHISLVSSAMDSIRRCVVVFKALLVPTSDLKSEFLCQSSYIARNLQTPRTTSYAWDISHALVTTYHPYCHSPSALTEYLKQRLHLQRAKRLGRSPSAQVEPDVQPERNMQDFNCSSDPGPFHPTPPDQPHADRSQSSDSAPASPEHLEHDNYDQPTVFINHFPHGNPGARMHEAPQGHHIYHSSEDMFGSSHWAPFRSQRDWQIAHWAKTQGPTSSALANLLAIPNVRTRHLFAISRY